ncbi:angiopoietin-4-like [Physella acuta]|uniref:angiopoietin-4-like n=1 Tax=Physella acuta TaxID=109671 RepID=UPI0027DB4D6D|nr:angiopoietin-4-like [Physella acuta]
MSSILLTALLFVNIMFTCGLDISLEREYYIEGRELFCAKLHCVQNTREDNEISALVNMSVYRISDLEGEIMLASVSESDSRVRDYKVNGSKADGKSSKVFGELTVSFTKPSDCFSTLFGCDVYYTNKRGHTEMKENKTKPVDQDNRKPLMFMTLEAKTPEFDKTIDRMSEFLKTFHDSNKFNSADLKMNLQFLTNGNLSNQIYHGKELHIEHRDVILANVTEMVEKRLNNTHFDQDAKIEKLNNKLNDLLRLLDVSNLIKTDQDLILAVSQLNNTDKDLMSAVSKLNNTDKDLMSAVSKLNNSDKDLMSAVSKLNNTDSDLMSAVSKLNNTDKDLMSALSKLNNTDSDLMSAVSQLNNTDKDFKWAMFNFNNTNLELKKSVENINNTVQKIYKKTYEHGELLQEMDRLGCRLFLLQELQIRNGVTLEPNRTACDMKTDGGGWIIIQRRVKGDVNFTRTWNDYKNGFGSTSGDFWIGNDVIYQLTKLVYNELRFDMKYKGKDYYAEYRGFKVENEAAKYKMSYTSFSGGNVDDKFSRHNGMKFTTIDSDNDVWSGGNCAVNYGRGGWWYEDCHYVKVNGEWASRVSNKGIHWNSITGYSDSLDFVEMKLRQM